MPLPTGVTQLSPASSSSSHPAYLFRPSQEVWTKLQTTPSGLSISFDNDDIHLNIPGNAPISLTPQTSTTRSEVYALQRDRLELLGIASTRLTIPIGSTSSRPRSLGDQLRTPALGANLKSPLLSASLQGHAMGRTVSSPGPSAPAKATPEPIIPLKTRVIQVLALGPSSIEEIVGKVGMAQEDVMRVVRAVGKDLGDNRYTLQPTKYAQVKIASWKYTPAEQRTVVRLAREAFDELGLPSDAEERADLAQKEAEIKSGPSSRSESGSETVPLPPARKTVAESTPLSSPRVIAVSSTGNASDVSASKKPVKKKRSVGLIGRERAKFAAQQQRASSMPSGRATANVASPRLDPQPTPPETKKAVPASQKRKREEVAPPVASGPVSPADSSAGTSTSEEARGRGKGVKPLKPTPLANGHRSETKEKRTSRDYSSSESDSEPEATPLSRRKGHTDTQSSPVLAPRPASIPSFKRKAPPELELNGHTNGHTSPPHPKRARPNEETLRDRYEELFPAYQLYTQKLLKIQQELQAGNEGAGEEEGEVVDQVEVGRMVKKWERWHRELEDIRRWFGESPRSGSS